MYVKTLTDLVMAVRRTYPVVIDQWIREASVDVGITGGSPYHQRVRRVVMSRATLWALRETAGDSYQFTTAKDGLYEVAGVPIAFDEMIPQGEVELCLLVKK